MFHHFRLACFLYFRTSRYWYLEFVLCISTGQGHFIFLYHCSLHGKHGILLEAFSTKYLEWDRILFWAVSYTDSCTHVNVSRKIVIWRVPWKKFLEIFCLLLPMCFLGNSLEILLSLQDFRKNSLQQLFHIKL